jgi:hypothetical protein
LVLVALAA